MARRRTGRETTPGAIEVDEWSQSVIPSIHAVGDVTHRAALTPVAIREGHAFARTVFKAEPTRADHMLIPTAIFTQPEVGTVGMTEAEAREGCAVEIYKSTFRPMSNVMADRAEKMLMKLIVRKDDQRVLGCHIVGHGAGEMIQLAAVAIRIKTDFPAEYGRFVETTGVNLNEFLAAGEPDGHVKQARRLVELLLEYKPLTEQQWQRQTPEDRRRWEAADQMRVKLEQLQAQAAPFATDWIALLMEVAPQIQARPERSEPVAPYVPPSTPVTKDLSAEEARDYRLIDEVIDHMPT